jgi:hypothetical protein
MRYCLRRRHERVILCKNGSKCCSVWKELLLAVSMLGTPQLEEWTAVQIESSISAVRMFAWYILEIAMQPATGAGRRRLKREPARSTLWLHRASLNSMLHEVSPSEEQAPPAVFQAATPSRDSNYSRPAITINSRPVTARAPPQVSSQTKTAPTNEWMKGNRNCQLQLYVDR